MTNDSTFAPVSAPQARATARPAPGGASRIFLALLPAGPNDKRLIVAVIVASLVVFAAAAPFAQVQLPRIEAFIPAYQSALVLAELVTAALIFGQYLLTRRRALRMLGSGYLFSGALATAHALSFPGLLAPSGVIGGGPQTTAWLYMFWHAGFSWFVLGYARSTLAPPPALRPGTVVAAAATATLALVVALTLLATAAHDALPAIMAGNREMATMKYVVAVLWGGGVVALVALWRRRPHSVLDGWLVVVMVAFLVSVALAAVLNAGRFDFGFYAGRVYGLLAGSILLVVLLLENNALYVRLAEAYDEVAATKATVDEYARRLEGRVEESEARYRLFLESAAAGIFVVDRAGKVLEANPATERLLARPRTEIVAQRLQDLVAERDAPRIVNDVLDAANATSSGTISFGRGNAVTQAEVSTSKVRLNDDAAFVVIAREVSERTRLQAQLHAAQKMEAIGQLTGGMAHDFNNLLTVIMGNLELLTDSERLDLANRELAARAHRAAGRGAELTRKLLAFTRRQPLQAVAVDVNEVVRGATELLRRTLGEQIEVSLVLAPEPWLAYADAAQVESALTNLAINARDALPNGGRLTIETANKHLDQRYATANADVEPGDYVMMAVSGTGTGIPPDLLQRVFEPFFTTKAPGKGTGRGPAMIYGFAKQSRGHVKIYSEVGHGTTVRLYLPRAELAAALAAGDAVGVTAPSAGAVVLLVEDHDEVRALAATYLRSLGYAVHEATNGPQALQVIDTLPSLDVLLTDMVMPGGMSGVELARAALAQRPGLRVLFASGFSEAAVEGVVRTRELGMIISKPYGKSDLARALALAMKKS